VARAAVETIGAIGAEIVAGVPPDVAETQGSPDGRAIDALVRPSRRSVTDHGIVVITEEDPSSFAAHVAITLELGARDEPSELNGIAHFCEHMLFRGTTVRSSYEVNRAVDATGGELDAMTAPESITVSVRVPADELEIGLDALLEVVGSPAMRDDDVVVERDVICEELAMVGDSPEEVAAMKLADAMFPGHGLGREILGTSETLAAIDGPALREFHADAMASRPIVVAAIGRVEHDALVERIGRWAVPAGDRRRPLRHAAPAIAPADLHLPKPTDQVQVVMGWVGPGAQHDDRIALAILLRAVGDGPASRLARRVRDELGMAYAVGMGHVGYSDVGVITLGCGTSPHRLSACRNELDRLIADVVANGLTDDEIHSARRSLCGAYLLALDDPGFRLGRLIGAEMQDRGAWSPAAVLDRYRSVRSDDVARVAAEVLGGPRVVVSVGPVGR